MKYENKENNHVVYFPLVLLCAVVCDCCFTVELEKKPVNNKCTGNNLGEWSPPGGLLVYQIAKIHLKCFVSTHYCSFTYTCPLGILTFEI